MYVCIRTRSLLHVLHTHEGMAADRRYANRAMTTALPPATVTKPVSEWGPCRSQSCIVSQKLCHGIVHGFPAFRTAPLVKYGLEYDTNPVGADGR